MKGTKKSGKGLSTYVAAKGGKKGGKKGKC